MNHGGRARIGLLLSVVYVAVLLASCGGGGGDGGWDGNGIEGGDAAIHPNGAVLVGIAGVTWSATNTTVDDKGSQTTSTATGATDETGEFEVASKANCSTTTDTSGKSTTTCDYSGFQPPSLSIGGNALPPLPAPGDGYSSARYALLDFGAAAFNVASIVLMGNSTPGDPLINGIKLSSGFSTTDCPAFDWSTTNIQQDAACFLTQANKDGLQHAWPSTDTVNQFLQAQWLRVHAGRYYGYHANTVTAAYPTAGSLSGTSAAIVSLDGTTEGWLDYTGSAQPNSLPGVPWSGTLAITSAAQGGSLTYTTASEAPIPDMTVNFSVGVNGADVHYQTADGSLSGTTTRYYSNGTPIGPGMGGPNGEPAIIFPKYHFQVKGLSYTRPGQSSPDNYLFHLEIGYGSYAEGGLTLWHPLPVGTNPPMWLDMYGQLNKDNTVTLHWYPDNITNKGPARNSTMTLRFDPNTVTLSGDLVGYDGTPWATITIQGWRT